MPLNKDGLEAGKPVDFATMIRVKREQAKRLKDDTPRSEQPKQSTGRREKPRAKGNGQSSDYAISRLADKLPTAAAEEKKS